MLLTFLVGVGAYEYIIRERDTPEVSFTGFWMTMVVAALTTAFGLAAALLAARFYDDPRLAFMIAVLAPLAFPAGWRSMIEAVMIRDGRVGAFAASNLIVETVAFACGITALAMGTGVYALLIHRLVQIAGAVPVYTVLGRWLPRFEFQKGVASRIAAFGGGLFGDRILGYLQNYGVDLILGVLLNPAAVALYRMGARMTAAISTVVGEQVRLVAWTRLTRARSAGESVSTEAERVIGAVFVVTAGPFVGLALTADLIVSLALGPAWAASASVVSFLALSMIVITPHLPSDAIFGAVGATRWLVILRTATISILLLFFVATASHGPVWAAGGQLAASAVDATIIMIAQRRIAGVDPRAYLPIAWRCAAAVLAMVAVVSAAKLALVAAGAPDLVVLAAIVALGGAAYLAVCLALFGRRIVEVVSPMKV
jgi:O-antigen/teichoic acid export membrane protein